MAVIDDYPAKLTTGYYRVRESWEDTASQVGAFRILANAIAKCDDNPGTYVFDNDGNAIYPEEETEEETGVEEESGVEEDTDTGDDTETGEEDTADDGAADDATEDEEVAAVSEDTDEEEAADSDAVDSDVADNNATDSETEDDTSDDAEDSAEEGATDGETGGESTDEVDADESDVDETDTEDASEEEFPAAEQNPVAYGRLKTLMNIRVEPSLEAEILTTYAKGTIVSILEILDTGWLKIICDAADDGYAYVSNEEGEYAYVGTSLYTVKSGDTLWKIAQEQLGSGTLYKEIRTLNGLTSNTIKVGMQLILP